MRHRNCPDILPPRGHAAKRRSIIDAAAAVFCREGFAGANIDIIAAEAGVSRQTIYNHHGDKDKLFATVLREITERTNERAFAILDTFPDQPDDLEADLVAFALRFNKNCIWGREGTVLRKMLMAEGERYPELYEVWRREGPGKIESALASRLARLAHAGYLDIDDPDIAARQFMALNNAEINMPSMFGRSLSDDELLTAARRAVRTFLRAFGRRTPRADRAQAVQEA
ncbi:TetR/AcrR family transcriptional regulator [Chelativorans sp. AA-79]|uniref:TetR/AcrR family transcriptional regulator n=1 Tax=Chelativorans sp. AA-79 TaxID=3028735 RepID=UPI0023F72BC1|nr:TetR/AcrR family transcriptional regulator [Chelativorans sp. AA-79]WEX11376.1 TetR/AcrR family transcriptional regulator [Chelativorans sp. AA-79]